MESQRFDSLTRMMASGASRRTVLRGALGGALAAVGLRSVAGAAPAAKVDICHQTGNGTYRHINVSVNALDAHIAHGDFTDCEGNFEVDFDSCTCVCGLTSCGTGSELNTDTCECDPVDECMAADLTRCSSGSGRCVESVDTGEFICAGTGWEYASCDSSADCVCEDILGCYNNNREMVCTTFNTFPGQFCRYRTP